MATEKVSIIITATDPNAKSVTTTVTDVNPEATNSDLVTFAQMLNGLTQNTYVSAKKVKTEVLF